MLSIGSSYGSTADESGIHLYRFSSGSNYIDSKTTTGGKTYFRTGQGTETSSTHVWMTVDASTGNVGIGTSTPSAILHVVGSANGELAALRLANGVNSGTIQTSTALEISPHSTGTYAATKLVALENSTSGYLASLSFFTRGTNDDVASTERMRIDSAGNVGIGTTAPNAKLKVDGGQIAADQFVVASGATVDFNNGNVQVLQAPGVAAITLNNMVNGGSYTLIITDTTSRIYTFTNCTNSKYLPANAATTAAKHSVYSILKVSVSSATYCYITWLSGF